jgi:GNAT superfamily N-acetyltransferase
MTESLNFVQVTTEQQKMKALAFAENRWPESYRFLYHLSPDAILENGIIDICTSIAFNGDVVVAALADHVDSRGVRNGALVGESSAASMLFRQFGRRPSRLACDFKPNLVQMGISSDEAGKVNQLMRVCSRTFNPFSFGAARLLDEREKYILPKGYQRDDWLACAYVKRNKALSYAFAGHFISDKACFIRWVKTPKEFQGKGYAVATMSCLLAELLKEYSDVFLYTDLEGPAPHIYEKIGFQQIAVHHFISTKDSANDQHK